MFHNDNPHLTLSGKMRENFDENVKICFNVKRMYVLFTIYSEFVIASYTVMMIK